jgi:xylulokinase
LAFLALDIGSSELKVTVYDVDGMCLRTATTEVQGALVRGDRAELEPEGFWSLVCDAITQICGPLRTPLQAASISSQGESFLPLDADGKAIGNIILNIDSRAVTEMDEFSSAFGKSALYGQTGLPAHPMYSLPKIAWLRKNEPEVFAKAERFVCLEDYILHRLGMEPVISSPLASRTMALDINRNQWAEDLLEFAGVNSGQFSRVVPSGTAVGEAARAVASELGLTPGMVWSTGGHDQVCASIGAGAQAAGTVADGTGTYECISAPLPQPLLSEASLAANLPCERHAISGQFLTLAYGPGGIALKWLRDNCNRDQAAQATATGKSAYELMLSQVPEAPTGLLFFPYFLGTGTPWLDSGARATIFGLTNSTTNEELVKAALEGVCYQMRWNLELFEEIGIHVDRILAVGGGAKSNVWMQLKADIYERPVVAVPGEASSRGAAICAGMGVNVYSNWNEAIATLVSPGRVFEPNPAKQRQYRELFEQYKELAERLYGHQSRPSGPKPNSGDQP